MTDSHKLILELEQAARSLQRARDMLPSIHSEKSGDAPEWPEEPEGWEEPPYDGPTKINPDDVHDAVEIVTFEFDPEGTTWQINRAQPCPACNNPSQKWSKNWMIKSANGKRVPAYRCGTAVWNPGDRRFKGPCDWVAWRTEDEYQAAKI